MRTTTRKPALRRRSERWQELGRPARERRGAGAFQQQHDLLYLSHVMDAQLFWLPLEDGGQSEDADAPQRSRKELRNWTSYNFQTLRDDVFMLGRDGTVTGRRVSPVRSACAVLVSSQNVNREWIYSQQQTVSAEGYSGQSFSPAFPHTVEDRGDSRLHRLPYLVGQ